MTSPAEVKMLGFGPAEHTTTGHNLNSRSHVCNPYQCFRLPSPPTSCIPQVQGEAAEPAWSSPSQPVHGTNGQAVLCSAPTNTGPRGLVDACVHTVSVGSPGPRGFCAHSQPIPPPFSIPRPLFLSRDL